MSTTSARGNGRRRSRDQSSASAVGEEAHRARGRECGSGTRPGRRDERTSHGTQAGKPLSLTPRTSATAARSADRRQVSLVVDSGTGAWRRPARRSRTTRAAYRALLHRDRRDSREAIAPSSARDPDHVAEREAPRGGQGASGPARPVTRPARSSRPRPASSPRRAARLGRRHPGRPDHRAHWDPLTVSMPPSSHRRLGVDPDDHAVPDERR